MIKIIEAFAVMPNSMMRNITGKKTDRWNYFKIMRSTTKWPHLWEHSLGMNNIWQYGLLRFQAGGTNLERFLPKINITKGNYWILRIGVMGRCQKVP